MINVIPNIYEAMREKAPEISVPAIFPSAGTQTLTQIAYYLKKQSQLGEQIVERAREQQFEKLSKQVPIFGQALKKNKKQVKYKFVVPNSIGFPVVGISSDINSIQSPIAKALGRNVNEFIRVDRINAPEDEGVHIYERRNSDGFLVKVFVNKYT